MDVHVYVLVDVDDFDGNFIDRFLDNITHGWLWSPKDN